MRKPDFLPATKPYLPPSGMILIQPGEACPVKMLGARGLQNHWLLRRGRKMKIDIAWTRREASTSSFLLETPDVLGGDDGALAARAVAGGRKLPLMGLPLVNETAAYSVPSVRAQSNSLPTRGKKRIVMVPCSY